MLGEFIVTEDNNEQNDINDTKQRTEIARSCVHVKSELDDIDLETVIAKRNKRQSKS